MFSSGCLELIVVAAAFVGAAAFVIACVLDLHTGMTLPLSALKALLAAVISFSSIALFLTMASVAIHFFGGRTNKEKE